VSVPITGDMLHIMLCEKSNVVSCVNRLKFDVRGTKGQEDSWCVHHKVPKSLEVFGIWGKSTHRMAGRLAILGRINQATLFT